MHWPELLMVALWLGGLAALAYAGIWGVRGVTRLFAREVARELRRQWRDGE